MKRFIILIWFIILICVMIISLPNFVSADTGGLGSWSNMTSPIATNLNGVWGSSGSDVFSVGSSGKIIHYNGSTWSNMTSPIATNLNGVWGSSGSDVFSVGSSGKIIHYNGATWSNMTSPIATDLNGVWGSSGSDVFSVEVSGKIIHYNGSTWASMTSPAGDPLFGVWGSSGSDVFTVGRHGKIYHYNGSTWASMTSPIATDLNGVWGSSGSDVFSVGDSGKIIHYNGSTWASMTSPIATDLNRVWGSSGSDVFSVGVSGKIIHYNGATWSNMTSPIATYLNGVWGSSGSDVFSVGSSGKIIHYALPSPIPQTNAATNNLTTTATLNGEVINDIGESCQYSFEYGDTLSYGATTSWTGSVANGSTFNENIIWLTQGLLYHYRARLNNSAGIGYGLDVVFWTSPSSVTNLVASPKSDTSVTLSWDKGTGSYNTMVRYKLGSYPTSPLDGTQGYYGTASTYDVSGLSEATTYYFNAWARAYDESTDGPYSLGINVSECTLPGKVINTHATTINDTAISLTWDKGAGDNYVFVRSKIGSAPTSMVDGTLVYTGTGTSYTDIGLSSATNYFYTIWANDSVCGYYSEVNGGSTDNAWTYGIPVVTTNPATYVTLLGARLNGYLDSDGDGSSTTVYFEWNSSVTIYSTANQTGKHSGNSFYADITGLTPGVTYYFRTVAINDFARVNGSYFTFTAPIDLNEPTEFLAYPASTSMLLTWQKDPNSSYTYIRYKESSYPTSISDGYFTCLVAGNTFNHTGLFSGHTYYYTAWSEDGTGNVSANYTFTLGTTLVSGISGGTLTPVGQPNGWFNESVHEPSGIWNTKIQSIPGYTIVNDIADTMHMPHGTFWFLLAMGIIVTLGLWLYSRSQNLLVSCILVIVLIWLGSNMGIIPLWFAFIFALIAIGMAWRELR